MVQSCNSLQCWEILLKNWNNWRSDVFQCFQKMKSDFSWVFTVISEWWAATLPDFGGKSKGYKFDFVSDQLVDRSLCLDSVTFRSRNQWTCVNCWNNRAFGQFVKANIWTPIICLKSAQIYPKIWTYTSTQYMYAGSFFGHCK